MQLDPVNIPEVDLGRQAVRSLGGYIYQLYQTVAAWLRLPDDGVLSIEVAEDYALLIRNLMEQVQVKVSAARKAVESWPAGRKVYQVRKRLRGQTDKITVTIGVHGVIAATVARERAKEIVGLMANGINPNDIDKKRKQDVIQQEQVKEAEQKEKQLTLEKVLEDYLQTRDMKPGTKYNYNSVIRAYLKDWLSAPMRDITKEQILERYQKIAEENGRGAANNSMRVLRALFSHATRRYFVDGKRVVTENPVTYLSDLEAWHKLPRRQTLLTAHQLKPWY